MTQHSSSPHPSLSPISVVLRPSLSSLPPSPNSEHAGGHHHHQALLLPPLSHLTSHFSHSSLLPAHCRPTSLSFLISFHYLFLSPSTPLAATVDQPHPSHHFISFHLISSLPHLTPLPANVDYPTHLTHSTISHTHTHSLSLFSLILSLFHSLFFLLVNGPPKIPTITTNLVGQQRSGSHNLPTSHHHHHLRVDSVSIQSSISSHQSIHPFIYLLPATLLCAASSTDKIKCPSPSHEATNKILIIVIPRPLFRLQGVCIKLKAMEEASKLAPKQTLEKAKSGLLQSNELYQYVLETSVYPREPEFLKELRDATTSHPSSGIATAPDGGQLMALLLKLINAKKTIEIGVFTGYSLLRTALSLPDDGKIIAIDKDQEAYEIGLPIIKKAGVEHKIDFIVSLALPVLDKLLENPTNEGSFDFAYVDADKINYWNYHERLLKLVRIGGIIAYDNTLWYGTVTLPDDSLVPDYLKASWPHIIKFNKSLASDPRVQISQVPSGDGVTICLRLY